MNDLVPQCRRDDRTCQSYGRVTPARSADLAPRFASPETRLRGSLRATRLRGLAENYFDDWVAQHYEVLWPHLFDPEVVEPAVSFLADLAGDGRALELGIGTGRLAVPLSRRGIRVDGIELSAAMVNQLRAQPGSSDIDVTIGDFSTTTVSGTFTLAYLVRNTIMNLTTQDAQVDASSMLRGI